MLKKRAILGIILTAAVRAALSAEAKIDGPILTVITNADNTARIEISDPVKGKSKTLLEFKLPDGDDYSIPIKYNNESPMEVLIVTDGRLERINISGETYETIATFEGRIRGEMYPTKDGKVRYSERVYLKSDNPPHRLKSIDLSLEEYNNLEKASRYFEWQGWRTVCQLQEYDPDTRSWREVGLTRAGICEIGGTICCEMLDDENRDARWHDMPQTSFVFPPTEITYIPGK